MEIYWFMKIIILHNIIIFITYFFQTMHNMRYFQDYFHIKLLKYVGYIFFVSHWTLSIFQLPLQENKIAYKQIHNVQTFWYYSKNYFTKRIWRALILHILRLEVLKVFWNEKNVNFSYHDIYMFFLTNEYEGPFFPR